MLVLGPPRETSAGIALAAPSKMLAVRWGYVRGPRRTAIHWTELTSQALMSALNSLASESKDCDTGQRSLIQGQGPAWS